MGSVDWLVLGAYLLGMVGLSLWLSRGQRDATDYYVGGRDLPWWAVAISTMATQSSANSFVGIPAFVALKEGGGLNWLQFELAVPLAMIAVAVLLLPLFREMRLVSVYEYLERRFDRRTRSFLALIFLLSRGLSTGVGVYASAVVLEACLGMSVEACIVLVCVVTIVYDTLGGMKAVVWSDVIQMVVLLVGLALCVAIAVDEVGGFGAMLQAIPEARLSGYQGGTGLGDGAKAPFWGFLVGGLFLYASYYGADQSQVQRELSAPSPEGTRKALFFNGVARFPLTALYLLMGLALGAAYLGAEDLQAAVPEGRLDALVPQFVLHRLPPVATGIVFAAILAAAMSSLDSSLNSLSASTVRDFVEPRMPAAQPEAILRISKLTTVLWGIAIGGAALLVGNISDTVVEGINKVGSMFYGPVLAAFLAGVLDPRARGPAVIAGVCGGVGVNLAIGLGATWMGIPEIFWMWWNLIGLVVAVVIAWVGSRLMAPPDPVQLEGTVLRLADIRKRERRFLGSHLQLALWFLVILGAVLFIGDLLMLLRPS